MTAPLLQSCTVYRANSDGLHADHDVLAEETAVALVYNGISHVVLMATPQDLEALALGFSLSEDILQSPAELYALDTHIHCNGIEIQMEISSARFQALKARRRNMSGRTGCGLCGIDSLSAVKPEVDTVKRGPTFSIAEIQTALSDFHQHQPLRQTVGSVHGAAWIEQGRVIAAFEDVGRHNALDKLIGHGSRHGFDWRQGFVVVSSRASYEMVAKAAAAGIGCMVAVSAPTALAVHLAQQAGMTLIGFARAQKFTVYSGEAYITQAV